MITHEDCGRGYDGFAATPDSFNDRGASINKFLNGIYVNNIIRDNTIYIARNPAFNKLLDDIRQLHDSKSADYADTDPMSNLKMCGAFGVAPLKGVIVRLSDKWSRIVQLVGGKSPKHESLRDTLIDNAVYSLLAVVLLDEEA